MRPGAVACATGLVPDSQASAPQCQHVLTRKGAQRGGRSGKGSKQHTSHALPPVPPSRPPLCEQLFSMLFFRSLRRMDGLKPMLLPLNS